MISIIAATYNAGKYIGTMLKSVAAQINENIELIIIDGNSKDNTIEIIKEHEYIISYWISEPDKGIYDAWNKGINQAKGDWIMFLGADDELLPGAISKYQRFIDTHEKLQLQYISSRIQMIDINGKSIRVKGWLWEWPQFLNDMTVAHPGSLHAKSLFEQYGLYDIQYKITGDYEMLLRPRENLRAAFMNEITVRMSEGGASDSYAAIAEHYLAATSTGGASKFSAKFNMYYIFMKVSMKSFFRNLGLNFYLKK